MSRHEPDPVEVVNTIYDSIIASPKKQKRLKSKTFWNMLGYQRRTQDRITEIARLLSDRNITVQIENGQFGSEARDEWLIMSVIEPPHPPAPGGAPLVPARKLNTPPDSWFERMMNQEFESEREVEHFFVMPLLEQLGYMADDIAVGFRVEMFQGVRLSKKEADVVVFDGKDRSPASALIVVEAKESRHPLTRDHAGQARGYAIWTRSPYYLITNGLDTQVWFFRGAVQQDIMMDQFSRSELRSAWSRIYHRLCREAVADYKRQQESAGAPDSPGVLPGP